MNTIYLTILSVMGIAVSFYLYYSKKYNKKLYCIYGKECDAVIKSRYGETFGIENTIFGILYYLLILAYTSFLFLNRNIFKGNIVYYFIVGASIGAVLFSVYLTLVQAVILKKWCDYCTVSAIISLLIFFMLII